MQVPHQLELGLSLILSPACGSHSLTGLPCQGSIGEDTPSSVVTCSARVGWYPGGGSSSSEENGREGERLCEGVNRKREVGLQSVCKVNK